MTPPSRRGEVHLEVHDARDALVLSRREATRASLRASVASGGTGISFTVELWGVARGEPVFGWLLFVLLAGLSIYFWFQRSRAEQAVASVERALARAEEKLLDKAAEDGSGLPETDRALG